MKGFWANLFGYQAVWFAAVIGAGGGHWWPGVVAAALFAAAHLGLYPQNRAQRGADLRLMAVAIVCGLLLDGALALSGLARYAAGTPALPSGGAPLWILSMWAAFALTLRHSMAPLLQRSWVALALGAIGGPLAYLGAGRGWSAITFAEPQWQALIVLALGWGLAIPLLAALAARWSRTAGADPVPATGNTA
jgi:hypothetical protein